MTIREKDKDFPKYIMDKNNLSIKKNIKIEIKIENPENFLFALKGLRKCLKK